MKQVKANGQYKFKAETWESSKGSRRGFYGWGLWLWIPETETWYKLEGSHYYSPEHPDIANKHAESNFKYALEGGFDKRIQQEIYGKEATGWRIVISSDGTWYESDWAEIDCGIDGLGIFDTKEEACEAAKTTSEIYGAIGVIKDHYSYSRPMAHHFEIPKVVYINGSKYELWKDE